MEDRSRQAGTRKSNRPRLGGAAALVPKAERLKRLHDARNMLREAMERWDDLRASQRRSFAEGQPKD